jgi:hypothetical protein
MHVDRGNTYAGGGASNTPPKLMLGSEPRFPGTDGDECLICGRRNVGGLVVPLCRDTGESGSLPRGELNATSLLERKGLTGLVCPSEWARWATRRPGNSIAREPRLVLTTARTVGALGSAKLPLSSSSASERSRSMSCPLLCLRAISVSLRGTEQLWGLATLLLITTEVFCRLTISFYFPFAAIAFRAMSLRSRANTQNTTSDQPPPLFTASLADVRGFSMSAWRSCVSYD